MRATDYLRGLRQAGQQAVREAEDARAMAALTWLPGRFLPWTSFSMRPAAILAVLSDIALHGRETVVELGSGNSTVFAARLLAQRDAGGHVHSVDHDPGWAEVTRAALAAEGLERFATVAHAPLSGGWYDRARLPEVEDIDLLVVDGPPGWDAIADREIPGARQPALDVLAGRLAPGATVVLDDAERPGEQRILASWEARHGLRFRTEPGGYAIASAPAQPAV